MGVDHGLHPRRRAAACLGATAPRGSARSRSCAPGLSRPCAWILEPGPRHLDILDALLGSQASVRLVTDAHLVAIAIEHGLELVSRDRDFARWADLGLRSRDPLA